MISIRYEYMYGPKDCAITVWYRGQLVATGNTGAEVQADAERQCALRDGFNLQAIGLNNRRSDWEAAFGPSDLPDTAFYDPELERLAAVKAREAIPRWWQRFWPRRIEELWERP